MRREREQSSEPAPPSTSNQAQANTQRNETFQDMEKTRAQAAATIADPGIGAKFKDGVVYVATAIGNAAVGVAKTVTAPARWLFSKIF